MSELEKNLGNEAFKKKDYGKAIEHYSKSIELESNNPVLYSNRSAAYYFLNNFQLSAKDAQKSIELDQNFIKGYFRFAMALIKLKDFQSSISVLEKGLEIDRDNQSLKDTLKEAKEKQQQYFKIQQSRDNILRKTFALRGQTRIDLESINLFYENLAKKISREKNIEFNTIYKKINELKNQDEEKILDLLKEYKNELSFVVACILYQHGILDYARLFLKEYLENFPKDQNAWTMITHIEVYSGGKKSDKYARKSLYLDPSNLFSVKTYLEVFSQAQITSIDDADLILKDLLLILNGTSNVSKGWLIEIGMKAWFFLMNNTRGALSQLKEIIDYSNQEGSENVLKIFNSHTSSVQPLVKCCFHSFFLQALQNSIIGRQDTEDFFKRLRYGFIHIEPKDILDSNLPLICSLSLQCHINDYCWETTEEEDKKVKELKERAEILLEKDYQGKWDPDKEFQKLLVLISLYQPLYQLKNMEKLSQINRKNLSYLMALIIRYNINEYIDETKNIKSITEPSLKWREINSQICKIPYQKELEWHYPTSYWPQGFDDLNKTKILITECLTGEEVFKYQEKYEKCQVIGISSNERDIAYGKRQSKELGYSPDSLICSSSLLYKPSIQFDVIEMDLRYESNPMESIKNILPNLREGGVVKFEFYSKRFVEIIQSAKKYLNSKGVSLNLATLKDKQNARTLISKNQEFLALTQRFNFFKLELFCQDLVSNVNGISLMDIEKILNDFDLSLISIVFPPGQFEQYVKENNSDTKGKNMKLVEKFDEKHHVFKTWIRFYCEKPVKTVKSSNDDPLGAKSFLMKHLKK